MLNLRTAKNPLILYMYIAGVLVNLEGSRFSSARGDLVVPVVATVAEVLGVNLAAMLMALHNNNKQGHQGDEASNMEASGGGSPATEEKYSNKVVSLSVCYPKKKIRSDLVSNPGCQV